MPLIFFCENAHALAHSLPAGIRVFSHIAVASARTRKFRRAWALARESVSRVASPGSNPNDIGLCEYVCARICVGLVDVCWDDRRANNRTCSKQRSTVSTVAYGDTGEVHAVPGQSLKPGSKTLTKVNGWRCLGLGPRTCARACDISGLQCHRRGRGDERYSFTKFVMCGKDKLPHDVAFRACVGGLIQHQLQTS